MARKRLATVEEAILVHLLDYSRYSPDDEVPIEMAQAGISRSIGARRSHVSMSLDSAKAAGAVDEFLSRVKGEKRKRKCYFLTGRGAERARALKEDIEGTHVEAGLPNGSKFSGTISELLRSEKDLALPRLMLIASDGAIMIPGKPDPVLDTPAGCVPVVGVFTGREEELRALDRFISGEVSVLLVGGMPGIGKTALVAHALAGLEQGRVFWHPISDWSSQRNTLNNLGAFLAVRGQDRLQRYLGAHETPDLADVRDILVQVRERTILVMDDCQNAGPGMVRLMGMLVSVCGSSELFSLAVVGRNVTVILEFGGKMEPGRVINLYVGPMEANDCIELLIARGVDEARAHDMAARSGGHPLYLVMASELPEGGENIGEMLAREIMDVNSPAENRLLHQLSVFREPVAADALVEEHDDFDSLDNLKRRCVVSNHGGWTMHSLIREFFYSRQTPAEREARHEKAAEYYNARRIGTAGEIEGAYHLLKAGDWEGALLEIFARGDGWLGDGYVDELLRLASMLPDSGPEAEDEYSLNLLLGSAHDQVGDWEAASEHYGICMELAREAANREREALTLRRQGAILYRKGELDAAKKTFGEALELLDKTRDENLLAEILGSMGVVLWKLGDVEGARAHHLRDLELCSLLKDRQGMARAQNNLGILDWQEGNNSAALERYGSALKHAERLKNKKLAAILYSNIADVHKAMGETALAKSNYEKCLEIAEDLKFNWQVAEAYRGLADIVEGNRAEFLQKALEIFTRLGAENDAKSVKESMG